MSSILELIDEVREAVIAVQDTYGPDASAVVFNEVTREAIRVYAASLRMHANLPEVRNVRVENTDC